MGPAGADAAENQRLAEALGDLEAGLARERIDEICVGRLAVCRQLGPLLGLDDEVFAERQMRRLQKPHAGHAAEVPAA